MTTQDHKIQAHHNQKFLNDISLAFPNQYGDWEIISMFYSALHLVDDYFSNNQISLPSDHRSRNKKIHFILPEIYGDYMDLYNLSMKARYRVVYTNITSNDMSVAQTRLKNIANHLLT